MIIWYCDICKRRIADDRALQCANMPVWEVSSYSTPVLIQTAAESHKDMEMIVCEECHSYILNKMYKIVQQAIKDKRGNEELSKE